jgi:hypothetical protein
MTLIPGKRRLALAHTHRVAIEGVAGAIIGEVPRARILEMRVIGAQSMTASQVQKSGEISRLRDMRWTPIERLDLV